MKSKSMRQRKMMLVLPLLVIPFLTMAFWALGGGKGKNSQRLGSVPGLNLNLPDAQLKDDKTVDKLSFYDKADQDSAKREEYMRSDPYYQQRTDTEPPVNMELQQLTQTSASKYNQRLNVSPYDQQTSAPEAQVMQKLNLLQKELTKSTSPSQPETYPNEKASPEFSGQVDRLESMMNMMNNGKEEDPEMNQLSTVMDKILDVQHPERVKQRLNEKKSKLASSAFTISSSNDDDTLTNGFYSFTNDKEVVTPNAIEAVVHEDQVLVNGAVIKLRLLAPIYVNGSKIPAGNFVFGFVSLEGERLSIDINSIRHGTSIYPVKLEVYDMDGLPGIYIPGAINRDVAKQSADNSLPLLEMSSLDPSLKARATTAGIGAVKSLLSKKVKLVKVMVKAGYKILLNNKN